MRAKQKPRARRARRSGAKEKKFTSSKVILAQSKRKGKPRSIPLAKLSARSNAARDRSLHVLAAMREDPSLSLPHAAKLNGVKPKTVQKYFPDAFVKRDGKLRVTKSDRYPETLYLPDSKGNPVALPTRSWKARQAAGKFLRDVGRFYRGDRNALQAWHGKKIAGVELVTDERAILAIEPALSDFSLYRTFHS
jgi:hypothetical protein